MKMIEDVELGQVEFNGTPFVRVSARPDALVRKQAVMRFLKARVCGKCGVVEFFVKDPEELLLADQAQSQSTRRSA